MKINENNEVVDTKTGEVLYPIISNPVWTIVTTWDGEIRYIQTHRLTD